MAHSWHVDLDDFYCKNEAHSRNYVTNFYNEKHSKIRVKCDAIFDLSHVTHYMCGLFFRTALIHSSWM